MKTAMQELIDWLKFYDNEPIKPIILKAQIQSLLEKEKESMLHFGLYVKKNGWVGCKIEDLYEDYNNQKK